MMSSDEVEREDGAWADRMLGLMADQDSGQCADCGRDLDLTLANTKPDVVHALDVHRRERHV